MFSPYRVLDFNLVNDEYSHGVCILHLSVRHLWKIRRQPAVMLVQSRSSLSYARVLLAGR